MGFNGGPKSIAIVDGNFAPASCNLPEPHQDGNVVIAEASGIYDVDGVVVTAGIGTGN